MMLRKTTPYVLVLTHAVDASMRPQHDAAENSRRDLPVPNPDAASMRPQHDAAENYPVICPEIPIIQASMRPQHDAAENHPDL